MLEFSLAETLILEIAIKDFMDKDMCTLDRHVCEQAYMKISISKKGQLISESIKKANEHKANRGVIS